MKKFLYGYMDCEHELTVDEPDGCHGDLKQGVRCGSVQIAERMSQNYEHGIGDPQMLSPDSQTEFSVSQIFFFHKQNFQFHKWLFFLQIENYVFTNPHIFVKTCTQVTNRKFVFVDSKTRVQLKAYL